MWEGIRSIINVKNEKSSNISLNIDNETITDDLTISNHFNNFFTSVAKNLVNKIPKTPKSFHSYLKSSNENPFFLSPTTKEDVEGILSTLKTNKTAGPDSVPTRILNISKNAYLNQYPTLLIYLFHWVPSQKF